MTDEERERLRAEIKEDAALNSRIEALEKYVAEIKAAQTWGIRAMMGAAIYVGKQIWDRYSSGGSGQ